MPLMNKMVKKKKKLKKKKVFKYFKSLSNSMKYHIILIQMLLNDSDYCDKYAWDKNYEGNQRTK